MAGPAAARAMQTRDVIQEIGFFSDRCATKVLAEARREFLHWNINARCEAIATELFERIVEATVDQQRTNDKCKYQRWSMGFSRSCNLLVKRHHVQWNECSLVSRACEATLAKHHEKGEICSDQFVCTCLRELYFAMLPMPEGGGARSPHWMAQYVQHSDQHTRYWALQILQRTLTAADQAFVSPLLDLMLHDPELELRSEAAASLSKIWRGKAPRSEIPLILPLLRARRERRLAFFPQLNLDHYLCFMDACFEMLAHATTDFEVQSEIASFFVSEIDWLYPPDATTETESIRFYQLAVLGNALEALRPRGGQWMRPRHLSSITRAFNACEHARKDRFLKMGICRLDPRNDVLAREVRKPGRPSPYRRASIMRGQRRIEDYFQRAG